mmetsp:Transcript_63498/g.148031  ORF Transcript_63498/g.148031 Transcript_63498/m.148031 type:complete len:209 (+) Transcript_63498:306-932(+)
MFVEGPVFDQVAVAWPHGREELRVRVPEREKYKVAEVLLQLPSQVHVVHFEVHERRRSTTTGQFLAGLASELQGDPLLPLCGDLPGQHLCGEVASVDASAHHQLAVLWNLAGHELPAHVAVNSHVCVQDALDNDSPQRGLRSTIQPSSDGCRVTPKQLTRKAGVVILQDRIVVVTEGQLALAVHHEAVGEAWVIKIVAQGCNQEAEHV